MARQRGGADPAQQWDELLRARLETALGLLGQGFLSHPENHELRRALVHGSLSAPDYLQQLIVLVHRLLFLFVAEPRGLLSPRSAGRWQQSVRAAGRLVRALRSQLLERQRITRPGKHNDQLWEALKRALRTFEPLSVDGASGPIEREPETLLRAGPSSALSRASRPGELETLQLPLPFEPDVPDPDPRLPGSEEQLPASRWPESGARFLDRARLDQQVLLQALALLAGVAAGSSPAGSDQLSPEQLCAHYQYLLELVPEVSTDGRQFAVRAATGRAGTARRANASFYTPAPLLEILLERGLEPLVAETIERHQERPVEALLELAIVDPACGCGHFLLAAARRLAAHLVRLRGGEAASVEERRRALAPVVTRCICGVDLDPGAVELCRWSLWLEVADPELDPTVLVTRVRHGHALLGAPQSVAADAPQARLACDAWCAALVVPQKPGRARLPARGTGRARARGQADQELLPFTCDELRRLARAHGFFHWHLEFPEVLARGGFDLVLGNPPWVSHAGRAAQRLPAGIQAFFRATEPAFAGYPTTHGMFVALGARLLRPGGILALLLPSSVADLEGYRPARRAHDRWCQPSEQLLELGEGRFAGVTQPCLALVSRRTESGRTDAAWGDPWPLERPDLDPKARELLARLGALPCLPPDLFGERGIQSTPELRCHFRSCLAPVGRFTIPVREGADVCEFCLLPPRIHVDPRALAGHMRSAEQFRMVRILIRQTAHFPVAALSDGVAFRNSVLAGFESEQWPAAALVALLNSALVRWLHYVRFRDARQPVLPQVKIAHLRALPCPPCFGSGPAARLAGIGRELSESGRVLGPGDRDRLDQLVFDLYGLDRPERELLTAWHDRFASPRLRRAGAVARRWSRAYGERPMHRVSGPYRKQ